MRHLEPKIPDCEIVKYFSRHFSDNIRDVILIQGIDTIERMLQYLRRIDDVRIPRQHDGNNEKIEQNRRENQNSRRENEHSRNYNNKENSEGQEGGRNYNYNRRYEDRYNRNYKNYEYRGNGRQTKEENQNRNRTNQNPKENQVEVPDKEEKKKTEWSRLNEITTAICETGPKNQNF